MTQTSEDVYERIKKAVDEKDQETLKAIFKLKFPEDVDLLKSDISTKILALTKIGCANQVEQASRLNLVIMSNTNYTKAGQNFNLLVYAFALRGDLQTVNSLINLISFENKISAVNAAIHAFSLCHNVSAVNSLAEVAAPSAVNGYAMGFHIKEVEELIEKGASIESAAQGFIKGGHCDNFFSVLQTLASIDNAKIRLELAENKELTKNYVLWNVDQTKIDYYIKIFQENKKIKDEQGKKNFDAQYFSNVVFQYEQQKLARKARIFLVVISAIVLTPFSLLVSLPLFFRAENKASIQKLKVSKKTYDNVKLKRQVLRGSDQKIIDVDKPPKVLIAQTASKIEVLADKTQRDRFKLFAKHDKKYLAANRKAILAEVEKSKQASKKLSQGYRGR